MHQIYYQKCVLKTDKMGQRFILLYCYITVYACTNSRVCRPCLNFSKLNLDMKVFPKKPNNNVENGYFFFLLIWRIHLLLKTAKLCKYHSMTCQLFYSMDNIY